MKTILTPKLESKEQILALEATVKTANETIELLELKVQEQQQKIESLAATPVMTKEQELLLAIKASPESGRVHRTLVSHIAGRLIEADEHKEGDLWLKKVYLNYDYMTVHPLSKIQLK